MTLPPPCCFHVLVLTFDSWRQMSIFVTLQTVDKVFLICFNNKIADTVSIYIIQEIQQSSSLSKWWEYKENVFSKSQYRFMMCEDGLNFYLINLEKSWHCFLPGMRKSRVTSSITWCKQNKNKYIYSINKMYMPCFQNFIHKITVLLLHFHKDCSVKPCFISFIVKWKHGVSFI